MNAQHRCVSATCLNCNSPRAAKRVPLCKDCLRMAFITALISSSATETVHKFFNTDWLLTLLKIVMGL